MKKALLLVPALLFVTGSLTYFLEIETPELGDAILARARDVTGLSLRAGSSRFSLRRGLSLEGVEASSRFPSGRYRVSAKAVVLRSRPSTLVSGRLQLSDVLLEEPGIDVVLGLPSNPSPSLVPDREPSAEPARSTDTAGSDWLPVLLTRVEVEVTAVELRGGTLVVRDRRREQNRLYLSKLNVRFANVGHDRRALTLIHGLSADGRFDIGELRLETTELSDIGGELAVERGRFSMDSLALTTALGRFQGNVSLDFNVIPFRYHVSLQSTSATIPGVGSGSLELSAEGFGTDSRNMSGEGRLELTEGEFTSSSLRTEIESQLGLDLTLRGRTTISFRLEKDRIQLERARITAGDSALVFEGSIELEGPIDLMVATEDGRSVHLTGTLDDPEVH